MSKKFAVSAYIENKGAILMVNHVKQQAWVPPGGKIDPDESPFDAVKREVREETGLIYDVDLYPAQFSCLQGNLWRMPGFLAYHEYDALPKGKHLCFSFLLHAEARSIRPCNEFTEHRWVSSEEARTLFPIPANVGILLRESYKVLSTL